MASSYVRVLLVIAEKTRILSRHCQKTNEKDAKKFIINFSLDFDITTYKSYNNQQVLLNCMTELQDFFKIDKWQINQPIIISEVQNLIGGVNGVQTIESLTFNNISGIFLSLIFSIIFGQISESIKKTAFGFQWFKNFFTKKFESKGKY